MTFFTNSGQSKLLDFSYKKPLCSGHLSTEATTAAVPREATLERFHCNSILTKKREKILMCILYEKRQDKILITTITTTKKSPKNSKFFKIHFKSQITTHHRIDEKMAHFNEKNAQKIVLWSKQAHEKYSFRKGRFCPSSLVRVKKMHSFGGRETFHSIQDEYQSWGKPE